MKDSIKLIAIGNPCLNISLLLVETLLKVFPFANGFSGERFRPIWASCFLTPDFLFLRKWLDFMLHYTLFLSWYMLLYNVNCHFWHNRKKKSLKVSVPSFFGYRKVFVSSRSGENLCGSMMFLICVVVFHLNCVFIM